MCAEEMGCGRRWVIWVLQEQGLPAGVQKCLEGFHRRCIGHLNRQFVPESDSLDAENVLGTAGTTSLMLELIDMDV